MRTSLFVAALAALSIVPFARPAAACGAESAVDRPVTVRPVNVAAADLVNEADRLESRAALLEARARDTDAAADDQAIEARALRIEAASVETTRRREQMFAQAAVLAQAALSGHNEARILRNQASRLRVAARDDRDRAIRLTGTVVRPGWRGGPIRSLPVTPKTPVLSTTDV